MLSFFDKWLKKVPVRVSQIDEVISKYQTLKLDRLNKVFSSDMSIIQISVCKNTIELYATFLKSLINAFENGKQLVPAVVHSEVNTIYIRDFFVDSNRNNLNPITATERFITLAVKFLSLYQSVENSSDKTFAMEKNLFLCGPIVSNIQTLLKSIQSL